jgi:S-DNA-T family DNA segregation ATPase FtsK/SpoIIIE
MPPPNQVERQGAGNIFATLIPMMGSMGVMVFMAMANGNQTSLMMGGGMVFAMLAMVGFNVYRQIGGHRKQVASQRREYLAYLAQMRETVRDTAKDQQRFLNWFLPDPDALVFIADRKARLWERELGDPNLLQARLGTSTQDLSMRLEIPEVMGITDPDPVCHSALSRFVAVQSTVDGLPFSISIGDFAFVELAGAEEDSKSLARAVIAHLATMVSPTLLKIAVLTTEANRSQWEWMKWLPHVRSEEEKDALGPARMITTDFADLADLLGDEVAHRPAFKPRNEMTAWPHVLVIVDGGQMPANHRLGARDGTSGVTVMTMPTQWGPLDSAATIRCIIHPQTDGRHALEVGVLDADPRYATADVMGLEQAEAIARRMSSWSEDEKAQSETPVGRSDPKRSVDLLELLSLGDIRDFDPEKQWVRREGSERLRVPFGVTPEGVPVTIDIKESAQYGMGPHGLLIGATGSGKSEVLRTLVLALSLTHSPEQLNFVLVDFKGGATFAGMSDLPHVSAMISNLESELFLVDRMQDALRGEMVRRQELLREAGNYANVTDYEADRVAGKHSHPPLPALCIILDEFSELLSAKPDFIETFVAIGRLGRSMSIHLLLSSQRLEEGRLRGLDSHLSYRIGLRTFSPQESRSVLGVPDAYELPSIPGVGYLMAASQGMTRFRASYVAAPPPARKNLPRARSAGSANAPIEIIPFTSTPQLKLQQEDSVPVQAEPAGPVVLPGDERWADMTEMDIAVAQMKGKGTPAHQVWLPPLDIPDTFDELMDDLDVVPGLGLTSAKWRAKGPLRIPMGTVDVPLEQRREVLEFDFSGAGGHMIVVGGPLSGKSTALRSIVMALSLTHTPQEVTFYIFDFGGGTFTPFDGAAHIAGVATRDQPDVINRMLAEILGIIDAREKYFRANRIDSISMYRAGRAEGRFNDGYGDVFLVIDGWSTLRSDFDDLETRLQTLAGRALTFGVHLIMSSGRWMDFRQPIKDVVGSKFELRLGDTSDSAIDRRIAVLVPQGRPGRGLEVGKHHALLALPRADGDPNPATLAAGIISTLKRIQESWDGAPGPKLRLLPSKITLEELRALPPTGKGLILGVEESRLGPLYFDPARDSHLYLYGDARSGKSTFLRSLAREIQHNYTPQQARIVAVDYRRALLGEIGPDYLFSYLTTAEETAADLSQLADFLKTRLPGSDVTTEQLRNRSWWRGAEIWVLVDDYDLVATKMGNPVAVLQPLLAQALDVGLHLIVVRRSGGAGRAGFEPVVQSMAELGQSAILLSGSPEEGAVVGRYKMKKAAPGRAQVITRDSGRIAAQLAWSEREG